MTKHAPKARIVTRDEIERLEAERPTHNAFLDYTIDGPIKTVVHASQYAQREGQIRQGRKVLAQASERLRHDQSAARLPGHAKVAFTGVAKPTAKPMPDRQPSGQHGKPAKQAAKQDKDAYVRAQKRAATRSPQRGNTRSHSP
ncbi:MAG: hypothetical protein AAF511_05415 [Pseudomonadota bacterium]